jgi:hypothetical protein
MNRQYWYIRYELQEKFSLGKIIFPIYQKRKPRIKRNDWVLVFSNGHFKLFGKVLETPVIKFEETELQIEEKNEYKYIIGEFSEIEEPNDLAGFAYSLPKIYKHYQNPEKHFKRDYGRISKYEFRVITQHDYYISRTAFGKIINSLHSSHRLAFIKYAAKVYPDMFLRNNDDFRRLFEILKNYVDNHIIAQSNMLIESDYLLKSELEVESKVGFVYPEDETNKTLVIERQVENIQQARKSMFKEIGLDTIADEIKKSSFEEELHRNHFINSRLPIIL